LLCSHVLASSLYVMLHVGRIPHVLVGDYKLLIIEYR